MLECDTTLHRWEPYALAGLAVVSLAARLYDLTGESLWYDEAYSVWTSRMDIGSASRLWDWQVEFPLYYLLLHYWIRLFGSGEWAVRVFGSLAGAATIVPLWLWARDVGGPYVAVAAGALLALNPYHVWYSQEVRMFPWAVLATVVSSLAFGRLMHSGGWGWWALHAASTGLGFHLHYYIGWVVIAQNAVMLWTMLRRQEQIGGQGSRRLLGFWALDQLIVLLLALPAMAVFATKLLTFNQWGWVAAKYGAPGWRDVLSLILLDAVGVAAPAPQSLPWLGAGVWMACGLVALVGVREDWARRRLTQAATMTLLPLGLVFLVGQLASVWVPRHLLLFLPGLLLVIAVGAVRLKRIGIVALIVLLAINGLGLAGMYADQQKEDWRGVAQYIRQHALTDDVIVLIDAECRVPFNYYYGDGNARVGVSRYAHDPAIAAELSLDTAMKEIERLRAGKTLWVVVSHADGGNLNDRLGVLDDLERVQTPDFVGLELVAYQWF